MSDSTNERLYSLLPAIYRLRDRQQGQPLRALTAAIEDQFQTLLADMEALYDNWFVETADDWVVPYIADLVGVDILPNAGSNQRRLVANTLGYRRRKGTLATLEHVAQDVSGWLVRAVDYGQLLSMTQHVGHVRNRTGRTVQLRRSTALDAVNGPFDPIPRTVDVRDLQVTGSVDRAGKYRPDHIGLFVWRLNTYPVINGPAHEVRANIGEPSLPPGCYTFDPLGQGTALFNEPQEISKITDQLLPLNVPQPISRVAFADDLRTYDARYRSLDKPHRPRNSRYYGPDRSVFVIRNGQPIYPSDVVGADLSQWQIPAITGKVLAIDPDLGRLRWLDQPTSPDHGRVEVCYSYGFSDDLGGGPYSRYLTLARPQPDTCVIEVFKGGAVDTLTKALAMWNDPDNADCAQQSRCIIQILDNNIYREKALVIRVRANTQLIIQAADRLRPIIVSPNGVSIVSDQPGASLTLNGLWIDGKLEIDSSLQLTLTHCTVMPHGLTSKAEAKQLHALQVTIDHCLLGPVRLPNTIVGVTVTASILDHAAGYAISAPKEATKPGPDVSLQNVTVFGKVHVQHIQSALNVIFNDMVQVKDIESGLIEFSAVARGSRTPRCRQCVLADEATAAAWPSFTSTRFGDPAYGQLSLQCAPDIVRGAADGAEMGAFHDLFQAQRQDNLGRMLNEYVPFGLTAGVLIVT